MLKKELAVKFIINILLILTLAYFLNPTKQLLLARNYAREYGARRIISALKVYSSPNHNGELPSEITAACPATQPIGSTGVDLEKILRNFFFKNFPYDPQYGSKEDTGYEICLAENGKIKVQAKYGEGKVVFIEE